MKRIKLILPLFFISVIALGQDFQGTVLDKANRNPIPFAYIYFPDLKTGTSTNEQGIFKIEHSAQRNIQIQISFVGYKVISEVLQIDLIKEKTFYLEQDHYTLQEVVISNSTGKLQGETIVNVDRKGMSELKQTSPLTLAEAISNIPGVEQNSTGAGIGKPVIRGLSGNRIVTYAQGIRIENQQWGDEHGLGVGEVGIESVEVIKGPASLLYGSDALGGVLYFIDERYAGHNAVEAFVDTKFLSNTLGTMNNVGFKMHRNNVKFNLFGAYSSQADFDTPKLDRVYNARFDEKNIKGSFGFNLKNWISNIRYSYLQNNYGIIEDAIFTSSSGRNFVLPFQTIDNHNLSLENIIFTGNSKLDFKLGYSYNYRREFEDDENLQALGLKLNSYTYNLKWYSPEYMGYLGVVLGLQGMNQTNDNNGEEVLIPNADTNDIGIFALANLDFENLQLQGGIRIDNRSIETENMVTDESTFPAISRSYDGVTFSGGAVYKFDKIKLRANVSSGFRAPTTSELLSNGVHEGTNRYERGNSNLGNETAIQMDLSIDYQTEHLSFSINPFYNAIGNYIFISPTTEFVNSDPVFEYLQTDAFLYGGEVGFHYHSHTIHWLHLESNLSTVFAEDTDKNELPLIPQTKISSTIKAEISQEGRVKFKDIFVQHVYRLDQNRIGLFETPTPSYHLVNIGMNLEIANENNPIEITTGVKNLFNTTYIDHLSRLKNLDIPAQGINFYIGLKLRLNRELKEKE